MLHDIFAWAASTYYFLARYAPGPWLISRIRRRDGLKWGVPAMLIAVPYFLLANALEDLIENGGSALLALPLMWCLVMGIIFLAIGPISLILLVNARAREAAARRRAQRKLNVNELTSR